MLIYYFIIYKSKDKISRFIILLKSLYQSFSFDKFSLIVQFIIIINIVFWIKIKILLININIICQIKIKRLLIIIIIIYLIIDIQINTNLECNFSRFIILLKLLYQSFSFDKSYPIIKFILYSLSNLSISLLYLF